ncbi:MAG: YIP1 family protein [Chloroflexota bacterium]|nr:YIP1 family protein [Chloroflexota bacterium]
MLDRIMGVITLKAPVYRQIADDKTATMQAAMVLVIATLISGFFGGLVDKQFQISITGAVLGAIFGVILALIGWVISSWVLQFVAKMLGGKTDLGEMLRVTGFVEVFSIVGVLNILTLAGTALSCVVGLIGLVVAVLKLIGYLIGVREAAEFSTTNAIITAVIAAIVNFIIVVVIGGVVVLSVVGALGLAGAVTGG